MFCNAHKKNKYSIVVEVNPSKPVLAVQPGIGTFVVTEFKHKLRGLSDDAVLVLANAIKGAIGTGGQFSNPLHVKPKMLASTQLNESKTNKNMKTNVVKINESTLRQIVAESVKKVLKESFGDVCYGRDDLLEVAERIANEFGNPSVGEELCGVMADAAAQFLKDIRQNPRWDAATQ